MAEQLFDAIKLHASITDEVIVSYSGGKDSAVVLDLACKYFKTVHAFFMYQVPELSFQEEILKWAENRYGLEIYRVPHFELGQTMRYGAFCRTDLSVPEIKMKDIYSHVRDVFACHWIAGGERKADSLSRRHLISLRGSADRARGRMMPIAYWKKEHVNAYIQSNKLRVSPESRVLGYSFRGLRPGDMHKIKEHYPEDFKKIERMFPFVGAAVARGDIYGKD